MYFLLALNNKDVLASTSLIKLVKTWKLDCFLEKGFILIVDVYEWWDFTWTITMAVIQIWTAYLPLFAIIYQGSKILLRNAVEHPHLSIEMYRRLQILVRLTNDCYQNTTAVYLMNSAITLGCVCGAIMLDSRIRSHLYFSEQFYCVALLTLCYIIFLFGYAFPGWANENSKEAKKIWAGQLSEERGGRKCIAWKRRFVRSCQDIRLCFGSVNYFEATTNLVIIQFVMDNTVTLLLLFARKAR